MRGLAERNYHLTCPFLYFFADRNIIRKSELKYLCLISRFIGYLGLKTRLTLYNLGMLDIEVFCKSDCLFDPPPSPRGVFYEL